MKTDVYNTISETCDTAMEEVLKLDNHAEIITYMIITLTGIKGICQGTQASEKGSDREKGE